MNEHLATNRAHWDSRVPVHLKGYDLDRFRSDPSFLSGVVRFDLPRLGDVAGLDGVHLQCHLGTDTLSLARLGARMTGLDLSPAAVAAARGLADELGLDVPFVEADVADAVDVLGPGRFDLVYTGVGALCWLPDVARWARVVAGLLRPGGRLFVRDGHPLLYALDDPRPDGLLVARYDYFEGPGVPGEATSTYEGDGSAVASPAFVWFNHGLAELFDAVRAAGLVVDGFWEHDTAPWNPFEDACEPVGDTGEWRMAPGRPRLPLTWTLSARKA